MNKIKIVMALLILCLSINVKAKKNSKGSAEIKAITAKLTKVSGTTPAQWRVIWNGDASRQATISWTTAEQGKTHKVYYGEQKTLGSESKCQRNGMYTLTKKEKGKVKPAYYHHAGLTGLKPDTRYYFVMESDGVKSKKLYFKTAPAAGCNFSVIHGGDSRSGHLDRCKVNVMIAQSVQKNPSIIAFAHGGDYIVSGKYWGQWRLWLSHHELTTCNDGRVLPIIPTRGNHDGGPLYKEVFNVDPKKPDWYTTNIGKDVAIVTLDTNVAGGGSQSGFLETELKKLRPKTKWLLTQYHRPLYPAIKGAPAHQKIFAPLFDKYNVDLACEADGHCIKRTIPIRGGKADPTGVTYIGEGGLGVGQRSPKKDLWYLKGGLIGAQHHIMILSFTKEKLGIKTVLLNGKVFDEHFLKIRK